MAVVALPDDAVGCHHSLPPSRRVAVAARLRLRLAAIDSRCASLLPSVLIGVLLFAGAVALYAPAPAGFCHRGLLPPARANVERAADRHGSGGGASHVPASGVGRSLSSSSVRLPISQNRRVPPPVGLVAVGLRLRPAFGTVTSAQEPRLSQRRGAVAGHGEQAPGECPRAPQLRDDPARERTFGEAEQQLRRSDSLASGLCRSARGAGSSPVRAAAIRRRTRASEYRADDRARLCRRGMQSLGEAYASQGQMDRASTAYERALALRPTT